MNFSSREFHFSWISIFFCVTSYEKEVYMIMTSIYLSACASSLPSFRHPLIFKPFFHWFKVQFPLSLGDIPPNYQQTYEVIYAYNLKNLWKINSVDKAEKVTAGLTTIIMSCSKRSVWRSGIILVTAVSRAAARVCVLSDGDLWETRLPYFL